MDVDSLIRIAAGLALLLGGAELLVRGAARLAGAFGVSPLVIGLTVVAYGTSAPELAVSVRATGVGQADIALGNVIGSNIFNVLFILGLSALITPLEVSRKLVRLDVPIMVAVSFALVALGWNGRIGRLEGGVLVLLGIAYTVFLVVESRREERRKRDAKGGGEAPAMAGWPRSVLFVAAGLALLVYGSRWLVDGAVALARALGTSELVIGLTVIAAGTSLPEVATSVVASLRGERDIAVGNVVGSNIFNVLWVLGVAAVSPGGVAVPLSVLQFDLPVMVAVAVACLPIFFTGYLIARWEGGLFFAYYLAYTAFIVLAATGHETLRLLAPAMLYFALPLTFLTLGVLAVRSLRAGSDGAAPRS